MMRIVGRLRRHGWSIGVGIAVIAALVTPFTGVPRVSAAASISTRVIPGESIGPARLGMSASTAASLMGPSVAQGATRRVYPRVGIVVDFDAGTAVRIATASAKFRTVGGAGVGTAAADTPRLVGDMNAVTTRYGQDIVVVYAFQGVGFVFRGGRAVETFVVAAIPFGPRANTAISPVSPPGSPIIVPGGPPQPPAGSNAPGGPTSSGAAPAPGAASAALRDVTANVASVGGITVTGTAVNTGAVPIGPLVVTAAFTRASGDQVDGKTTIPGPLAPGASAPFAVRAAMVADVIIRYQVSLTTGTGTLLAATPAQAVPASAYADFAQRQIHVKVDLGAPSQAVGPPKVQALVSVADTGAIPAQWVQQITVAIPYTSNGAAASSTVQLRPGQTATVLVPAGATLGSPQITGVVLSGQ
jgi:hypothetical protein